MTAVSKEISKDEIKKLIQDKEVRCINIILEFFRQQ